MLYSVFDRDASGAINGQTNLSVLARYHQNGSKTKRLGAVYTPAAVAFAMARWAIRSQTDTVLDPACGDGAFLLAARIRLAELGARTTKCVGVDIDRRAAALSRAAVADFFEWARESRRFDVILANPPFIRSHLFRDESRQLAFALMQEQGLRPSRLMSTWAPFVAVSERLCAPKGRMAFVVPEELLHVGYAAEIRRYLLNRFRSVVVCLPGSALFSQVQQAVVLLLCDRGGDAPPGLSTIAFDDLMKNRSSTPDPAPTPDLDAKWTHLFLTKKERDLLASAKRQLPWAPLAAYGRVEVGVVTGDNDFFLIPGADARRFPADYLEPVVASAKDLSGVFYRPADRKGALCNGRPAYLLSIPALHDALPPALAAYLRQGRSRGVPERYKCRVREPWYSVPSVWPAHALMLRQSDGLPRIVGLETHATATDTLHRVRWKDRSLGPRLCVGFLNSWTLLNCELSGRSYGGGVLELMPSEANALPIPPPTADCERLAQVIDLAVRSREYARAVEVVDECVLGGTLKKKEIRELRALWLRLVERRRSNRLNGKR